MCHGVGLIRGGDGTSRRLLDELRAYLASMEADQPGLLNIYLDPADVAADEDVLAMLTRFAPYSAGDFASLLGEARHG